jgi:hypothetical protein
MLLFDVGEEGRVAEVTLATRTPEVAVLVRGALLAHAYYFNQYNYFSTILLFVGALLFGLWD